MEFDKNTGDCFISDETFSMYLNTSKSTVSREIKALELMGYVVRNTKNVKGGKERHLKVNQKKIEEDISNVNLSLVAPQQSKCLLSNVNLPIDNKQNDLIKDKLKDNLKDNKEILSTDVDKISYDVADGLFCREIDGLFCRSSPDIIVRRRCVLSHKRRGWLQPSPSFRYSRNLALQDELYHPVINNGPAVLVCVDKRLGTGPVNQSRDAG